MLTIPNYQILTQIYESANSLVYRAIKKADNQPVILKALRSDYPTKEELSRYRQEYDIVRHLNLDGVIKAYSLEKYQNTLVMCLEDFGGGSLKHWLAQRTFSLEELLRMAISAAEILAKIHQQNIIHKDINPANLIFNPTSGQLKIIDFGISTQLSRETPELKNPNVLEGTLAYMSPEQTGRMNRALDYRSDFYSLGVTFYQLLTGTVPFEATDAMELVHCHIAKTPTLLCQVNPKVPAIVSDIVIKLMAKNIEDRYQSAFGLKWDLEKCLEHFEGFQNFQGFSLELAQQDLTGKFQIPQKLYGRENEVQTLLQAFERVVPGQGKKGNNNGLGEMMLVAGYSGVGKSALVHEVHKPMTSKHGYFAAGKFDQFQRNIPYFAITAAFNEWCNYLLAESSEQLNHWREQIMTAVGNNGQVLIEVIPHLELIIGKQPDVAKVGAAETQNRFNRVFQDFFRAICQPEHPLVLFIDDLQWADLASLNLLKTLMIDTDHEYFLIIGAYRDNEVEAAHPLMMMVKELTEAQATVNTIHLQNLSYHDVNTLIAETLKSDSSYTQPLANLVYDKTQGNAFFTREFLKSLYAQELLAFDWQTKEWRWDVDQIIALELTDNVVVLMAESIRHLSEETQDVLKFASCIGNRFDLKTLSVIYQHSPKDTLTLMFSAIEEGLIMPLDNTYQAMEIIDATDVAFRFKFQHDRVQQSAYSLMACEQNQAIHLQIGRLLLASTNLEENLFEIVNQFNKGIALVAEVAEQLKLVQLNLMAGQKAKAATAYQPAFDYLQTSMSLLESDAWQQHYSLAVQVYTEAVEIAYLSGNLKYMEHWAPVVLQKANTLLEQVKVYEIQIQAKVAKNQPKEALEIALTVLKQLDISFPDKPSQSDIEKALAETASYWHGHKIETLSDRPIMIAPEKLVAIRLLSTVATAAYNMGNSQLYTLMNLQTVRLSLQYGNTGESIFGYATYGLILCGVVGEIEEGFQFGKLACDLVEQLNAKEFKAKAFEVVGFTVQPWKEHVRKTLKPLQEGYQSGLETGDFVYGAYSAYVYCLQSYLVGKELTALESEMVVYNQALGKLKQNTIRQWNEIGQQTVLNLMEMKTENSVDSQPYRLTGEVYNEDEMRPIHQQANDIFGLFFMSFHKLILCYLFEAYPQASENALMAEKHLGAVLGSLAVPLFHFYDSLVKLAVYSNSPSSEQEIILKKVAANQEKMATWAKHAPMNYLHKYYLVEAERCRVLGLDGEAREYYDNAIELAHENEYINEEALAYEVAGRFYLAKGKTKFAQVCLREAHYAYQQWGALAKVKDLEERYPQMVSNQTSKGVNRTITPIGTLMSSTSSTNYSTLLDLSSVVKASQTLSGEIVLSCLLEKMMLLVIENAGAEKGFLLLPQKEQWFVEAESDLRSKNIKVLQSIPIDKHQRIAATLIHYVARTQEHFVLDNASVEGQFIRDPYIVKYRPQSVLCVPLINQGHTTGILYLENNLTEGAFTPDRLQVLQVLSSQIAISIENALLYRTLEQKVEERTAQLAEANQEITVLNKQLKSENRRMSAELDVSRQLQQMLLPNDEELEAIDSLDIAGFMEPADEVGGDYYDVLQHNGRILFGIGDVTGHGLESGVLAIMVQAVVRALLCNNETDPVKFLSTINQTVYNNVLRMHSEKNLTLALLEYQDNVLYLSGQHEEMIVVRQGVVERIDTDELGFMIGLEEDIADFVAQEQVVLNVDDVVVLYTDGITEAINSEKEEYRLERLCQVVEQNWQRGAKEIRQAVIDDVRQFIGEQKVFDDITLLVLKRR